MRLTNTRKTISYGRTLFELDSTKRQKLVQGVTLKLSILCFSTYELLHLLNDIFVREINTVHGQALQLPATANEHLQ